MNNSEDLRILAEIAYMYYIEDTKQSDIAKKFNISRSLVSRYLTKCREHGIVEFIVHDDYIHAHYNIENKLKEKFNLKEVICVSSHNDKVFQQKRVGAAASKYLLRHLKKNSTVAVAGGTTINETAHSISSPVEFPDVSFVSIVGGLGKENQDIQTNAICDIFANKLNSDSIHLYAPVLVDSEQAKNVFIEQSYIKDVFEIAQKSDFALLGIGGKPEGSSIAKAYFHYLETEMYEDLTDVVGDICYNFINKDGKLVECDWNRRVISLRAEFIKKIPNVIGIAEGLEKVEAIHAVLTASLIDTLIIDEITANSLLNIQKKT